MKKIEVSEAALDTLQRMVEELQAERDAFAKDAARLRAIWMGCCSDGFGWWLPEWCVVEGQTAPTFAEFCAQIDKEKASIDEVAKSALDEAMSRG